MSINEKLKNLYYSKLPELIALVEEIGNEDKEDYEGPLLMHCWKNEYLSCNKKILFVGQETNGWNGFLRPKSKENIDKTIEIYKDFELGASYNSLFWQKVNYINKNLNGENARLNFMWTNVLKFGKSGKGRPKPEIVREEVVRFNILTEEIKILNPNAIIFFSGPLYDIDITKRIGDVTFSKCSQYNERELAQLIHPSFPEKTFRTYHPKYLNFGPKNKVWKGNEIIDKLISLLS